MLRPKLIPPLDRFAGPTCRRVCRNWGITLHVLAARTGMKLARLERWQSGRIASATLPERGEIYDAMLDLLAEQAAWATAEIAEMKRAHRGR